MKARTLHGLVLACFIALTIDAQSYTITDTYVGANDHRYGDIIGDASLFDVSKMDVSVANGNLTVDVYSRYLNNIGVYQTQLGDLFISSDGWDPYGAAPYLYDNAANGEQWEYALVLDNHLSGTGGSLSLYPVGGGTIRLASGPAGYVWRDGQPVQFLPGQPLRPVATGTWSIHNVGGATDADDFIRFSINRQALGGGGVYGFSWGMTCGNDIIQGAAPVPEPSTLDLIGPGLAGLAFGWFLSRRAKAKLV